MSTLALALNEMVSQLDAGKHFDLAIKMLCDVASGYIPEKTNNPNNDDEPAVVKVGDLYLYFDELVSHYHDTDNFAFGARHVAQAFGELVLSNPGVVSITAIDVDAVFMPDAGFTARRNFYARLLEFVSGHRAEK